MKKSSLKKYITLLEAAADSATHARDYWMREHERRVDELLEADNEIAELKRRLDVNGGLCTLRARLVGETCKEANDQLWEDNDQLWEDNERLREDNERLLEDNERLSSLLRSTEHNHTFERDNNDTQA